MQDGRIGGLRHYCRTTVVAIALEWRMKVLNTHANFMVWLFNKNRVFYLVPLGIALVETYTAADAR